MCVGKKCCLCNEGVLSGGVGGVIVWYVNDGVIELVGRVGEGM